MKLNDFIVFNFAEIVKRDAIVFEIYDENDDVDEYVNPDDVSDDDSWYVDDVSDDDIDVGLTYPGDCKSSKLVQAARNCGLKVKFI